MRLKLFLVLLLFFITNLSFSQIEKILTIDEAVLLALNNNKKLNFYESEVGIAKGILTNAGIIPNPEASFYKEDLSANNLNYYEWTLSGLMPLNFIWNRWSEINSASANYEASKLEYEKKKFYLVSDVKSAYVKVHFYNEIYNAWRKAFTLIENVKQIADARTDEGEISGYDKQRILIEYLLCKKNFNDSKIKYQSSLNELLLLIDLPDSLDIFKTTFNYNPSDINISLDSLINTALHNRSDLKVAMLRLDEKSSVISNQQLKIIPEISFNFGYKMQSDNFEGLVYGLNIGIPLFDRNQGRIEIANAEFNQQKSLYRYLQNKTQSEVKTSYQKFSNYQEQILSLKAYDLFNPEEVIATAEFSYSEGEMSLIELLDAIRAYSDSFLLSNELLLNYYQSLFELEKAIGKELYQ